MTNAQLGNTINDVTSQRLGISRTRIRINSRLNRDHNRRRPSKILISNKRIRKERQRTIALNIETARGNRSAIKNDPTLIHKPFAQRFQTIKLQLHIRRPRRHRRIILRRRRIICRGRGIGWTGCRLNDEVDGVDSRSRTGLLDPERVVPSAKRTFETNRVVSAERVSPGAERRENIGSRCVYTKEQEAEQVCRIRAIGRLGKGRAFLDADERHRVAIPAFIADQISCG